MTQQRIIFPTLAVMWDCLGHQQCCYLLCSLWKMMTHRLWPALKGLWVDEIKGF